MFHPKIIRKNPFFQLQSSVPHAGFTQVTLKEVSHINQEHERFV